MSSSSALRALYVHIPFCGSICPFCSFAVWEERPALHEAYLHALIQELRQRLQAQDDLPLQPLESLYFGGGTPSRLHIKELQWLFQNLQRQWPWADHSEITFELNPEDVTPNYVQNLKELGVTRLSLGGQSFDNASLRSLGRRHTGEEVFKAVEIFHKMDIENFNLDLMFGFPQQSLSKFQQDVGQALACAPHHISLYGLEIHPHTKFGKNSEIYDWTHHHQHQFESMYLWAVENLSNHDYLHYEVSNFSRPSQQGKSNQLVWSGEAYLGIGAGAHSYLNEHRWGNVRSVKHYIQCLHKTQFPVAFEEQLTPIDQANECLMLGLRQPSGFQIHQWQEKLNIAWPHHNTLLAEQLCQQGFAQWTPPILALTPKGLLRADEITARLMLAP